MRATRPARRAGYSLSAGARAPGLPLRVLRLNYGPACRWGAMGVRVIDAATVGAAAQPGGPASGLSPARGPWPAPGVSGWQLAGGNTRAESESVAASAASDNHDEATVAGRGGPPGSWAWPTGR